MGLISKISYLSCALIKCQPCKCFPLCLTDTEFDLTLLNFGGTIDFAFVGSGYEHCCKFGSYPVARADFSVLNGNYILPYAASGSYILNLATCAADQAESIRANGILVGRSQEIGCGGTEFDGDIVVEREHYVVRISVGLACSNATTSGQMSMTPGFVCCTVFRPGVSGPWQVQQSPCIFGGGTEVEFAFCDTQSWVPNVRALPCEVVKTMTTHRPRGTLEPIAGAGQANQCYVNTNCSGGTQSVTAQGFIRGLAA